MSEEMFSKKEVWEEKPFFQLRIPTVSASLNALFAMNHWQRMREKKRQQAAFLSACRSLGSALQIPATAHRNTSWTLSDILAFWKMTEKKTLSLRSGRKKLAGKRRR
jgi:hypothetical protein